VPRISEGGDIPAETSSETKLAVIPMMPAKQANCRKRITRNVLATGAAPYVGIAMI